MKFLDADYETKSLLDVTVVGAAKYAKHPSTKILMVSFSINGGPEINWNPYTGRNRDLKLYIEYLNKIKYNKNWRFRAHHSEFEYWITNEVGVEQFGFPSIPVEKFFCTQSLCGANSYPVAEASTAIAMHLEEQKDKEGSRLISMFSKPSRKKGEEFKSPHDYPKEFNPFTKYCDQDVRTQKAIVKHCQPLTPLQVRVMELTEKMNVRGLPIDKRMCKGALRLVDKYKKRADQELTKITKGKVSSGTQTVALTKWLNAERGAKIPNLQAPVIEKYLKKESIDPVVKKVLLIRSNVSKSSTAKYTAALNYLTEEGLVHGFVKAYFTITGRWAGRGLQIQNFSKPDGKIFPGWHKYDIEYLCRLIRRADLETIELLYGDVMDVLKGATRSIICAPEGYKFICADYSQIEARIVMWLAGCKLGLKDFGGEGKIYEKMGGTIFDRDYRLILKPSYERDVAKETVLGCGFGMGADKFWDTCVNKKNLELTLDLAKFAVKSYRKRYVEVPAAWYECEEMAIKAIQNPGHSFGACNDKLFFEMYKHGLRTHLPSGRYIHYPEACVKMSSGKFGPKLSIFYKNWKQVRGAGKQWDFEKIWGGTLFQHPVQGIAGDIMANGLLNAEKAGYFTNFTVHDEGVSRVCENFGTVKEYEKLLCTLPSWAKGMPIVAEGWEGRRYRK